MPQHSIIIRTMIYSISQIDPEKMYVKSYLSKATTDDGKKIYPLLIEKARSGELFTLPGKSKNGNGCHLWLGADILKIIAGDKKLKSSEKEYANKLSSSMDKKQQVDFIIESIHKSKKIEYLKKQFNRIKKELKEQKKLLQEYQLQIGIERNSRDVIRTEVIEYLFESHEPVHWFQFSVKDFCGIYCLILKNEIIYVGQSVNIPARIASHYSQGKIFDGIRFFICKKEDLNEKEMFLIKLLKPKLNGNYKNAKHPLIQEFSKLKNKEQNV